MVFFVLQACIPGNVACIPGGVQWSTGVYSRWCTVY